MSFRHTGEYPVVRLKRNQFILVKYEIVPKFNNKLVVCPSLLIVPHTTVLHVATRVIILEHVKNLIIVPLQVPLICGQKLDGCGWQAAGQWGMGQSSYQNSSHSYCHSHGATGFCFFCLLVYPLFVVVHWVSRGISRRQV